MAFNCVQKVVAAQAYFGFSAKYRVIKLHGVSYLCATNVRQKCSSVKGLTFTNVNARMALRLKRKKKESRIAYLRVR